MSSDKDRSYYIKKRIKTRERKKFEDRRTSSTSEQQGAPNPKLASNIRIRKEAIAAAKSKYKKDQARKARKEARKAKQAAKSPRQLRDERETREMNELVGN